MSRLWDQIKIRHVRLAYRPAAPEPPYSKRRMAAFTAVIVATMATAACAAATAKPPPSAPRTMYMAMSTMATTLDPTTFQLPALYALMNTQEPFLAYGYRSVSGSPVPLFDPQHFTNDLAQAITIVPGKSVTITLRPAKSPYDHIVSSADVKWTLDRDIALKNLGEYAMSLMHLSLSDPITIISARTFRLNLTGVSPLLDQVLTWWMLAPFDSVEAQEHATKTDPWATHWLSLHTDSFGPYQVTSFKPGVAMTLSANPYYWGGEPPIHRIVITAVPSAANRQELLQSGTVQFVPDLPSVQLKALSQNATSGVRTVFVPFTQIEYLDFNLHVTPLDNPLVRKAILYAIPYNQIVSDVYNGHATVMTSPVPTQLPYALSPSHWPYTYNVAKAKALLAEAGYSKGFSIPLTYSTQDPQDQQIAIRLQSALGAVGISVTLDEVSSYATFQANLSSNKYAMPLASIQPFIPDAAYSLYNSADPGGPGDNGFYVNATIDQALNTALSTDNAATRSAALAQAQEAWIANPPDADLVQPDLGLAFSGGLTGYRSLPTGFPFFKYFTFAS